MELPYIDLANYDAAYAASFEQLVVLRRGLRNVTPQLALTIRADIDLNADSYSRVTASHYLAGLQAAGYIDAFEYPCLDFGLYGIGLLELDAVASRMAALIGIARGQI